MQSALSASYVCSQCGTAYAADVAIWCCAKDRGILNGWPVTSFAEKNVDVSEAGLWRYAYALPPLPIEKRVRLGEVMTPMVLSEALSATLKLDFMLPSGSYKDRGSAVLISRLAHLGIRRVVEDSSGNAGASIAGYSAASGIACEIYVPAGNSPDKLAQIKAYGADLHAIDGDRAAVADAALRAAESSFYASHNYHPDFHAGVSTVGFEIWEQLGHRAPDAVVVPAGHGSIVLGLHRAFKSLAMARAARMPKIFAVQSRAFSSLARAWADGKDSPAPVQQGTTIAEGIATRLPLRGRDVLAAVQESEGEVFDVSEDAIKRALARLVRHGFFAEPTSAVAIAGLDVLRDQGMVSREASRVVVVLTGNGLKASRRVADLIAT